MIGMSINFYQYQCQYKDEKMINECRRNISIDNG